MKETYFNIVSVLLVFVVFAVFPMSLDAEPYEYNIKTKLAHTDLSHSDTTILDTGNNIRIQFHLLGSDCGDEYNFNTESYKVPPGRKLTLRKLSLILIAPRTDTLEKIPLQMFLTIDQKKFAVGPITYIEPKLASDKKTIIILNDDNDIFIGEDQSFENVKVSFETDPSILQFSDYTVIANLYGYLEHIGQ